MSSIIDSFRLNGKVALVTGAARGLGQGMALALAEAGADIVAVDILPADDTVKQVSALGRKAVAITGNLGVRSAIPAVIADARKHFNSLDILVNCAGIIRRADFLDFSEKDWDDVMGINIDAVFFLSQCFVVPSYTCSKSAVQGLTRLMANELAAKGINANAIAPGYMATDNTAPLRADSNRANAILERIPAGRWGTPDDLKGVVVFLASAASDYVNGYTIAVDGGWLAR